jgi:hypothetical protein
LNSFRSHILAHPLKKSVSILSTTTMPHSRPEKKDPKPKPVQKDDKKDPKKKDDKKKSPDPNKKAANEYERFLSFPSCGERKKLDR